MSPRFRTLPVLSGLLAAALAAPAVRADSEFWAEVRRPGITAYRRSMAEGRVLKEQGRLREALTAFDRATAALPDEAEGHLWRGNVLADMDDARGAVDAWTRAREIDPMLAESVQASFQMAIALSKMEDYVRTVAEYERIITRLGGEDAEFRATVFGNLAEAQMAQGRDHLDAAVRNYRRSIEEVPTYRLGHWGLAVALDRQGSSADARQEARRAVDGDPAMGSLRRGGVFFIPRYEIHAYLALGHDAQAHPTLALDEWRQYLADGGDAGPWRDVAERHVADLGGTRAPTQPTPLGRRLRPRRSER